jgi:hypothetical protein
MVDGSAALRAWVAKLRTLDVGDVAARDVAKEIQRSIIANAARSRDPNGKKWADTEDGRRAMRNLASNVRVRVVDGAIVLRLEGHYARHHLGAARGKKKREMIPTGSIPDAMTKAIRVVVEREFEKAMKSR